MSLLNTFGLRLKECGRNLLRLLPASWLLTNTMCLLMNSAAFASRWRPAWPRMWRP